jgi:hypothetical protein
MERIGEGDVMSIAQRCILGTEIENIKKKLIQKAVKKGIYENFGQNEIRDLQDKYGYTPEIKEFDDWAMNFDQRKLEEEKRKLKKVM